MFIFNCGFSTKVTCAFLVQKNIQKLSKLNTIKPRKQHYLSDKGLKGIRCESDSVVFVWSLEITLSVILSKFM